MQLTINSFRQLFFDKIFFLDSSLTFSKIPDISLTAVKFPDISRFSRQVVTMINVMEALKWVAKHALTAIFILCHIFFSISVLFISFYAHTGYAQHSLQQGRYVFILSHCTGVHQCPSRCSVPCQLWLACRTSCWLNAIGSKPVMLAIGQHAVHAGKSISASTNMDSSTGRQVHSHDIMYCMFVAWHSGRTSVFDRRTLPVLHSGDHLCG